MTLMLFLPGLIAGHQCGVRLLQEDDDYKRIIRYLSKFAISLLSSFVVYKIIWDLALKLCHIQAVDYRGADSVTVMKIKGDNKVVSVSGAPHDEDEAQSAENDENAESAEKAGVKLKEVTAQRDDLQAKLDEATQRNRDLSYPYGFPRSRNPKRNPEPALWPG